MKVSIEFNDTLTNTYGYDKFILSYYDMIVAVNSDSFYNIIYSKDLIQYISIVEPIVSTLSLRLNYSNSYR